MENIIENYKSQMEMVNTQMLQGLRLIEDLTIFYKALNNPYKFSEYNGVQWSKKMNIWIAYLDFGTSKIPIGGYTTEEDAYNGRNSYIEANYWQYRNCNACIIKIALPNEAFDEGKKTCRNCLERRRRKYDCACGGKYSQGGISHHRTTKRHQDYLYENT